MMNSLLEQEKKNRLKNGTLVIGKADFPGENPEVSGSFNFFSSFVVGHRTYHL